MTGRVGKADQALAVPATPADAVDGPSGFDPSRIDFVGLAAVIERDVELAAPLLRKWHISWQQRANGYRLVGFVIPDEDALLWNKSLNALAELAKAAPLLLTELRRAAIATEAGTAETENTGSVHEGAGRNAALPETKAVDPYALGGGK